MQIKRATLVGILAVCGLLWTQLAWAQDSDQPTEPQAAPPQDDAGPAEMAADAAATDNPANEPAGEPVSEPVEAPDEVVDYQAQIEQAAVIKAQAEAEKAKAEAEKAKAEAEKAKAEAAKAKAELAAPQAVPVTAAQVEADLQAADAEAEVSPGYHRHDGFFLRLTAGPGLGGYSADGAEGDPQIREIDGPVAPFWGGSLQLGGAVQENLIVYADLWGISIFDIAKTTYSQTGMIEGYGGVGLGVGYYIMPNNVHISGSVGPAFSVWDPSKDYYSGSSDDQIGLYGVGINVMIGQEWWVSDNWGLGFAINADYAWLGREDYAVNTGGVTLLFTATYN